MARTSMDQNATSASPKLSLVGRTLPIELLLHASDLDRNIVLAEGDLDTGSTSRPLVPPLRIQANLAGAVFVDPAPCVAVEPCCV